MQEISKYKTTFFLRYFGDYIFYTLLTIFLKDKGFSGTQVGAILSFSPVILAISMPIWLMFENGKSRKKLVVTAVLSIILLEFVIVFVPQFAILAVVMVIYSVARSPLSSSMESMAYVYCAETKKEYSGIRIWGSAGYIVAIITGSFLYKYVDFIWLAVVSSVLLISFIAILMHTKPLGIDGNPKSSNHNLKQLFSNKKYLIFLFIQTTCLTLVNVNNSYDLLYQQSRNMDTSMFGITTLIRVSVEIGILTLLSRHKFRLRYLFLAVPILMTVQSSLYFLRSPVWTVFAVMPLTGIATGIIIYLGNKYISTIVRPHNITVATYAMIILNNLFLALCLFLGGIVIDYLGINFVYLITGIAFVLCAALIPVFIHKDPTPVGDTILNPL